MVRKVSMAIAPLLTLLIIYGSLTPNPDLPIIELDHVDKIYHGFAYFLLMISWYTFFKVRFSDLQHKEYNPIHERFFSWERSIVVGSGILCFLIGAFIELAQGYLAQNRSMDALDLLANTVGILFAISILRLISLVTQGGKKHNSF